MFRPHRTWRSLSFSLDRVFFLGIRPPGTPAGSIPARTGGTEDCLNGQWFYTSSNNRYSERCTPGTRFFARASFCAALFLKEKTDGF
jgi:hypothetical protein